MDIKPKMKEREFISIFLVMFLPFFFVLVSGAMLAFLFLGGFPSKPLMKIVFLGVALVGAIISMLVVQWKNDTSELPILKTVFKLIGVIGLLPLIAYVPMLIVRRNIEDLSGVFQILIWLAVIGFVVSAMLKIRSAHTSS